MTDINTPNEEIIVDEVCNDQIDESLNLDENLINEPAVEKHYTITHAFFIAGVQHHQMNEVLDILEVGMELTLVPEPTNPYDPNAVRIELHLGLEDSYPMLGYVPKKFSSEVCAKFAAGRTLECIITGFYPEAKPWERCFVEIHQLEE